MIIVSLLIFYAFLRAFPIKNAFDTDLSGSIDAFIAVIGYYSDEEDSTDPIWFNFTKSPSEKARWKIIAKKRGIPLATLIKIKMNPRRGLVYFRLLPFDRTLGYFFQETK